MTFDLNALLDAPLAIAGWTVVVVLVESAVIALLLAGWRLLRASADPAVQYRAAALAFVVTVLATVVTPIALIAEPAPLPSPGVVSTEAGARPHAALFAAPAVTAPGVQAAGADAADALLPWLGVAWCIGAGLLALRLFAGWLAAHRLRRQSSPLGSTPLTQSAARLAARLGVRTRFALLESKRVDAPIVVGARRPALILPSDLSTRMSLPLAESLLAHELRHVARADYRTNLWQCAAEAMLFFSPAARWISGRVREAREFDCDETAAAVCGDRGQYAEALTALAAFGCVERFLPVVGAAGPKLVTRIRHLLHGSTRPRFVAARLVTLVVGLALLFGVSRVLADFSVAQARTAGASSIAPGADAVPLAWVVEQPGSAVHLGPVTSSDDHLVSRVTVRNTANADVTAVAFVIVVENTAVPPGIRERVRLITAAPRAITIPPGAAVEMPVDGLAVPDLNQLVADFGGRAQVTVGVRRVEFANRWIWDMTPNPEARTAQEALHLPPAEVPRAFLGVLPEIRTLEPGASGLEYEVLSLSSGAVGIRVVRPAGHCEPSDGCHPCFDQHGREYSEGAIVAIQREPGRFARCEGSRWMEAQVQG